MVLNPLNAAAFVRRPAWPRGGTRASDADFPDGVKSAGHAALAPRSGSAAMQPG